MAGTGGAPQAQWRATCPPARAEGPLWIGELSPRSGRLGGRRRLVRPRGAGPAVRSCLRAGPRDAAPGPAPGRPPRPGRRDRARHLFPPTALCPRRVHSAVRKLGLIRPLAGQVGPGARQAVTISSVERQHRDGESPRRQHAFGIARAGRTWGLVDRRRALVWISRGWLQASGQPAHKVRAARSSPAPRRFRRRWPGVAKADCGRHRRKPWPPPARSQATP